jgi:hypothetical protein
MITEFRNGINGTWPSRNEKKNILKIPHLLKNEILKTKKRMNIIK